MSSLAGTDGYTTIHIRPSKGTTSDMHMQEVKSQGC